jgi:hypothetical protein
LAVVGVVAAVGVAAFVLRSSRPPVLPATTVVTPAKQAWDGTSPLRCGAQQHLTVEGLNVSLPGVTAIVADGHCHLELVNVALAAEVGIEASGNATVTVTGGKLSGTRLAVRSLGNAHVELEGTAVTGKTERVGNGKIDGP